MKEFSLEAVTPVKAITSQEKAETKSYQPISHTSQVFPSPFEILFPQTGSFCIPYYFQVSNSCGIKIQVFPFRYLYSGWNFL
jgi:hypothetical protein